MIHLRSLWVLSLSAPYSISLLACLHLTLFLKTLFQLPAPGFWYRFDLLCPHTSLSFLVSHGLSVDISDFGFSCTFWREIPLLTSWNKQLLEYVLIFSWYIAPNLLLYSDSCVHFGLFPQCLCCHHTTGTVYCWWYTVGANFSCLSQNYLIWCNHRD